MENPSSLHLIGQLAVAVGLSAIFAYVAYELRDFMYMIVSSAQHVRTFQDLLGVLLIVFYAATVVGDYLAFLLIGSIWTRASTSAVSLYIHLLPYLLMCSILLLRVGYLLILRRSTGTWRPRRRSAPVAIFAIAGVVNSGDYLLREFVGWASWVPAPWQRYWLLCSAVAGATWFLAATAYLLSSKPDHAQEAER
jgi:hypothetical protein